MLRHGCERPVHINAEILIARALHKLRVSPIREDRVHGIRRGETEHAAAWTAECLQQLLQNLIRAIGRPHLRIAHAHAGLFRYVVRQGLAQLHRITLRIAIECGGKAPGLRHQVIH